MPGCLLRSAMGLRAVPHARLRDSEKHAKAWTPNALLETRSEKKRMRVYIQAYLEWSRLIHQGQFEAAVIRAQEMKELASGEESSAQQSAEECLQIALRGVEQLKQIEAEIELLDKASTDAAQSWLTRGLRMMESGAYLKAAEAFNRAVDLNEENAFAWCCLGVAEAELESLFRLEQVLFCFDRSLELDPKAEETLVFFKIVQNKLHFAISGKTAAELIAERADASQPNMGLTAWTDAKARKGDVTIAKNYLNSDEMDGLNRIVSMYLDYAEDQAKRHRQIFMRDWRTKLDAFLQFNERDILTNAGKVSKAIADQLALEQYEQFNQHRLAVEAEQEALLDDDELQKFLTEK